MAQEMKALKRANSSMTEVSTEQAALVQVTSFRQSAEGFQLRMPFPLFSKSKGLHLKNRSSKLKLKVFWMPTPLINIHTPN